MFAVPPLLAAGVLAVVALSIWLLYRIRPARQQREVASMLLWRGVLAQAWPYRLRWLCSLLLALAIGLTLAMAWMRPELTGLGASHQRLVVILDNSSSMGARTGGGGTRWQRALADARELIRAAPAGSEVLVRDTSGRARLTGFMPAVRALEQLDALVLSPEPSGRIPPLPAAASVRGVYLFTDGVGIDDVSPGVVVRSVFEAAANVGITAFEGRPVPADPTRYQIFVQVENASATPAEVTLEVAGTDGFRVQRTLQVAADPANVVLDVSGYAQGPLRAVVRAQADAFDLDDNAYWVVPAHRIRRVLLVTAGNELLADSLRTLPAVALSVRRPAQVTELPPFDAYVFDRYAPPQPPPAGALLFHPPAATWLAARWREEGRPSITGWNAAHPLGAAVAWPELRLDKARLAEEDTAAVVVGGQGARGSGALVLASRARARWIALGFDLADSNFPLQPGFPVFLGTALEWLADTPITASANLGRVEVPLADARVRDLRSGPVAVTATASGTLFEAASPGIYLAQNPEERRVVVANATDPRTVRINDTHSHPLRGAVEHRAQPRPAWPAPWRALLAFAFLLMVLEWPAFGRRLTE